jgi:hypothetical protein
MTLVEKLIKLAEDLEKEGFIEESDQLTNALETDVQENPTPLLIDKDDEEVHQMESPEPSMTSQPSVPVPQPTPTQAPTENISQLEEDLTTGVLALLAKNNDFVLSENGEIGNSDEEFVDALLNLAS